MIYLASDHAGLELKDFLTQKLTDIGQEITDCGPYEYDALDDYPDFIIPCAQKVAGNQGSYGIILGGSGQGEAIAANKVPGIRAIVYYGGNSEIIALSKAHNNANILSLGARMISAEEAWEQVQYRLVTSFTNEERHVRRLNKITIYESK